jgi:predicted nucleic acid-binding protein
MKVVFADSYYFLAGVNKYDVGHTKALSFARSFRGRFITTEWVLSEVGDALAQPRDRPAYLAILQSLRNDVQTTIVEASHQLFVAGVELYAERPDKEWSLTDCVSFIVMEEQGIREALTSDHHFEQAGFLALLK